MNYWTPFSFDVIINWKIKANKLEKFSLLLNVVIPIINNVIYNRVIKRELNYLLYTKKVDFARTPTCYSVIHFV